MDKRQKCDSECVLHDAAYSMICFNHGISEDSGNEGVVELDDSLLMEYKEKKRIVVNRDRKKLLKVDGVDLSEVKPNQILDLSEDGDRWEGDVLNDKPFGWGVLYDSEGRMVYEGFRVNGVNVCYGRQYYADISQIEYEGEIYEGMRWGRGIHYDRSRKVNYDGEWLHDEQLETNVTIIPDDSLLHNRIEKLVIADDCYNEEEWSVLDFGLMRNLKSLKVGDGCFKQVKEVKMVGLNALKSVVIGEECFTKIKYSSKKEQASFRLEDCPELLYLMISKDSFSDFTTCKIENMNALERIIMKKDAFHYASSLELKSSRFVSR